MASHRLLPAVALALISGATVVVSSTPGPFAFLEPSIQLTSAELAALGRDQTIARALPADDGHLAMFAAARLHVGPEALMSWTRVIDTLHRGPFVKAIGRFSSMPVESDVDGLTLDAGDLDALRRCRPGDCKVKLAAAEIVAVQQAIAAGGADWRAVAERAFRRLLLARVEHHRARGLASLDPYADRETPASIYEAFAGVVTRSPYLTSGLPELVVALERPSLAGIPRSESLYYWSKEHYGTGKPVVSVTHVRYWMPDGIGTPAAVAASTQIFASHYINGALGLTLVLCEPDDGACYLAYINRTHTDLFGGLFGGVRRGIARQRIESQGPAVIRALRDRLQSAPPSD
jgi:hypothetical protein